MLEAVRHGSGGIGDRHLDAVEFVDFHPFAESSRIGGFDDLDRWIGKARRDRILLQKDGYCMGLVGADLVKVEGTGEDDHRLRHPGEDLGKIEVLVPWRVLVSIDPPADAFDLGTVRSRLANIRNIGEASIR